MAFESCRISPGLAASRAVQDSLRCHDVLNIGAMQPGQHEAVGPGQSVQGSLRAAQQSIRAARLGLNRISLGFGPS